MTAPDVFFSADDGLGESRHVFLAGNGLPQAWAGRDEFVVSELGFGTGLNLLTVVDLLRSEAARGEPIPRLVYQSVEWEFRPRSDVEALAERWPELADIAEAWAAIYAPAPGWNRWSWRWGTVVLYGGDARDLPRSGGFQPADAWFLDGYAPDRCPELWEPDLLRWVATQTKPGGSAATYSAAGVVKQGLRAAGFQVTRSPGWGKKRHMVRACLPPLP